MNLDGCVGFHLHSRPQISNMECVFIGELDPDEHEDVSEVEYLLNPSAFGKEPRMLQSSRKTVVHEGSRKGRNDSCPCGSGLKYKKCCLLKEH